MVCIFWLWTSKRYTVYLLPFSNCFQFFAVLHQRELKQHKLTCLCHSWKENCSYVKGWLWGVIGSNFIFNCTNILYISSELHYWYTYKKSFLLKIVSLDLRVFVNGAWDAQHWSEVYDTEVKNIWYRITSHIYLTHSYSRACLHCCLWCTSQNLSFPVGHPWIFRIFFHTLVFPRKIWVFRNIRRSYTCTHFTLLVHKE